MGHPIPPIDLEYEEGDECPACVNVIFNGRTPRVVKALFTEITPCEGSPPTGVIPPIFLLPIGGCSWEGFGGEFEQFWAYWYLDWNGWSILLLDGPGGHLFYSEIENPCVTSFGNDFKCEEYDDYEGGGGAIRWGRKVDEEFWDIW